MREIIYQSEAVNISSTDHTFAIAVNAIWVGGAGTVVARLRGDSADSTWVGVQAGSYLLGDFTIVRRTSTTATDMRGVSYRENQRA